MNHMTFDPEPATGWRVVVTGASSGIGLAAASLLAAGGAEVLLVSRDLSRGLAARDQVAALATGLQPTFLAADLSSQASIRDLSARLHERFDSIDVLLNNAGTASNRRELTVDGIERTFATNHLAPFLLTHQVIDLLLAAPAARIVTTTSESHSRRLDFDNLQGERGYNFFSAYARSKLANILFTYELARRLAGTLVTANCFTPGPSATNFGRGGGGAMGLMSALVRFFGRSSEGGARTAVHLATSPEMEGVTGLYYFHGKPVRSKPITYDPEVAARLWATSELLTNPGREITHQALEAIR
jgi:NAD(P)-dependent dehydrogenase (short-subunit alcohol dehydrogenase family)